MNQFAILASGGQMVNVLLCLGGYEVEIVDSNGMRVAVLSMANPNFLLTGFQTYFVIPRAIGPGGAVTGITYQNAPPQYNAVAGGPTVITVTIA